MSTYLVEVDDGFPEGVLHLVEIAHADFSEVTWMVLVEIGAVVMLATRHTATTGVLPVLADTSMTGGDMAAAITNESVSCGQSMRVFELAIRTVSASWLLE